MTVRIIILLIILGTVFFTNGLWAQSCYELRLKKVEEARKLKDYKTAIAALKDKNCTKLTTRQKDVLQEYLNLVNEEYIELLEADNQVSSKIAKGVYFYDNKLALAAKEINGVIKYGFINKKGEPIIDYLYDEAILFDEDIGYAKVKKDKKYYYLDTMGTEYLLAESVQEMTRETEVLDLSRQGLKKLPEKLQIYTQLKILNLYDNEFYQLPDWIEKLKYLEEIYLGYNMFNEIPESIFELKNLRRLDLYDNEITYLPTRIQELKPLQYLTLSYNAIEGLPEEIKTLEYLKELNLLYTPLAKKKNLHPVLEKRLPKCLIRWEQ